MTALVEGRVAIVTGAGRGIEARVRPAPGGAGAKVVVNDLGGDATGVGADLTHAQSVVEEIRAAGGEAVANGADVSNWNDAKAMVDQAISTYGKLDVLVNNAGNLRDRMLVNMSEEDWDAVIHVHLKGHAAPSRHAAAYFRDRFKEEGDFAERIINTSSSSGIYGNVGQTNYGAAKMGIGALTIISARELRRYGVTVNAIAPIAMTRLTAGLRERTAEEAEASHPSWVAPIVMLSRQQRPVGRGQRPDVRSRAAA